jgi:hypothetical protein
MLPGFLAEGRVRHDARYTNCGYADSSSSPSKCKLNIPKITNQDLSVCNFDKRGFERKLKVKSFRFFTEAECSK